MEIVLLLASSGNCITTCIQWKLYYYLHPVEIVLLLASSGNCITTCIQWKLYYYLHPVEIVLLLASSGNCTTTCIQWKLYYYLNTWFFSQGVGGSVHLPRGYLKQAYEAIRAKGGVCIMDEVSLQLSLIITLHVYLRLFHFKP